MLGNKRCILVVDDEVRMVRALSDFLTFKGFSIIKAYDGEEALDKYYKHSVEIDMILLDVMLPLIDGFSVLEALRREGVTLPILMLTARGEESSELQGFHQGADDYIAKPFSEHVLLARMETILKRVGKSSEAEMILGDIRLNELERIVSVEGEKLDFTKREFELLKFLMRNDKVTFTREQLLDQVWGLEFEGDIRTVDTHIKQLRMKLGSRASYIQTMHRVGYKFEVQDENLA